MRRDLYQWDYHSDQPHVIRNKKAKRKLYIKGVLGSLKTLVIAFIVLPIIGIKICIGILLKRQHLFTEEIGNIGLCVNPENPLPEKSTPHIEDLTAMIDELGVSHLLIRVPLSDIKNIKLYIEFAEAFSGKDVLIDILQDREHIEDKQLLQKNLTTIFSAFTHIATNFKIGNAINRRKWGFVSIDEYFRFFAIAQRIRDKEFPGIKLLGGNIIDFELPNLARSLFHFNAIKYDANAAQLYVDRRGAPENKQMGCDLISKINWFDSIIQLSHKSANELWITETNWPLKDTEPFAPAIGDCMVDENLQAAYLVRYYLLAMASGRVTRCYWHQLVAPGYGLIDNRGNSLRKRKAFYSFKLIIKLFTDAKKIRFTESNNGIYILEAKNKTHNIQAVWANNFTTRMTATKNNTIIDILGNTLTPDDDGMVLISDQVIYFLSDIDAA